MFLRSFLWPLALSIWTLIPSTMSHSHVNQRGFSYGLILLTHKAIFSFQHFCWICIRSRITRISSIQRFPNHKTSSPPTYALTTTSGSVFLCMDNYTLRESSSRLHLASYKKYSNLLLACRRIKGSVSGRYSLIPLQKSLVLQSFKSYLLSTLRPISFLTKVIRERVAPLLHSF